MVPVPKSGPWFNIKMLSYQFRKSHCGDRWYYNCLTSRVGFTILSRWQLYIESDTRPIYPWTCLTCCKTDILAMEPVGYLAIQGGWYKDCRSRYRDSHYKDKMVISPSYLYIGHSFPGPVFYLTWSKLRLCSANHRPGYWSNLPCDWPSTAWAYSE